MAEKIDLDALKREGFAAQRRAGVNVDWFTWQIAWRDAIESRASQPGSGEADDAARWREFIRMRFTGVQWTELHECLRLRAKARLVAFIDAARAALAGREES